MLFCNLGMVLGGPLGCVFVVLLLGVYFVSFLGMDVVLVLGNGSGGRVPQKDASRLGGPCMQGPNIVFFFCWLWVGLGWRRARGKVLGWFWWWFWDGFGGSKNLVV